MDKKYDLSLDNIVKEAIKATNSGKDKKIIIFYSGSEPQELFQAFNKIQVKYYLQEESENNSKDYVIDLKRINII